MDWLWLGFLSICTVIPNSSCRNLRSLQRKTPRYEDELKTYARESDYVDQRVRSYGSPILGFDLTLDGLKWRDVVSTEDQYEPAVLQLVNVIYHLKIYIHKNYVSKTVNGAPLH